MGISIERVAEFRGWTTAEILQESMLKQKRENLDAASAEPGDDDRTCGAYSLESSVTIQLLHCSTVDPILSTQSLEYRRPGTYVRRPTTTMLSEAINGDMSGKRLHSF